MPSIYQPAEDSFLLAKCVSEIIKKENPENILEIGSGSGFQAKSILNLGINPEKLTLTDLNKESIKYLKKIFPKSKVYSSDLFEKIKEKFNLILFNPPYLPKEKFDDEIDTCGGKDGSEIINKFLKQAKNHLKENGKIILLTSNLTKEINWFNYKKKLIGKKKLFFEELYVWMIWN